MELVCDDDDVMNNFGKSSLLHWIPNNLAHLELPCLRQKVHSFFMQMLSAVKYIHSFGFVHRDIKPENIFVDGRDFSIKIGDFGFAKYIQEEDQFGKLTIKREASSMYGTVSYRAPEILEFYDYRADLFSLGLILFDMCHLMQQGAQLHHYNITWAKQNNFPPGF